MGILDKSLWLPRAAFLAILPFCAMGSEAVQSGCEPDYAPFCFVREDGQADGFSVELLREALKAVNREVAFKTACWATLKEDLTQGRLQVLPFASRTPGREEIFDFTFPYLTMSPALVVRADNTVIDNVRDLRNLQVAVLREDMCHEYLQRAGTGAILVPLDSYAVAMQNLSEGLYDAVLIQRLLAFQLMKALKLNNLKLAHDPLTNLTQNLCFAVREGDSRLLSALNEGLSIVIANGRFRSLQAKWFAPLNALQRGRYSIVVGCDSYYPPFEFADPQTGQPAGYNIDLVRAIARQMGLKIEFRMDEWSSILGQFERGEIDLLSGVFFSPGRTQRFAFSPPHSVVHIVGVGRRGGFVPEKLALLDARTLLVQKNDIAHDLLLEQGHTNLITCHSPQEALKRLAAGAGDGVLAGRRTAVFAIKNNRWRNLVLSDTPVATFDYCFGAAPGNDMMLSDFTEGLDTLKVSGEYYQIQKKWLFPYDGLRWHFRQVLRVFLLIIGVLLVMLLFSMAWTRSLRRQVIHRTGELRKETEASREMARRLSRTVEELGRSNEELAQFAHVASHDLKEPLRMVTSFMSLLKERCAERLDARALEYVELAYEGSVRMQNLVDDLLAYSRIGRSKERVEVDCHVIVNNVLKDLQETIRVSEATVTIGPLPVIRGNAMEMTQLFQNLISNAVKFKGSRKPYIHVSARRELEGWQFDVQDNGIGIDPQYQERVFRIFQRLHTAEEYPGTGIGLAICKKIVENLGGRIWFDSVPGEGTTFHALLPG